MGEGEERSDIAVLKSQMKSLQDDVAALEKNEKDRTERDRALLIRGLMWMGLMLTTLVGFLYYAVKDKLGP